MLKRGRRQSIPVHNHFKFDDITSTSICIHCEKSIPEKYSTNLLAHMKIYHRFSQSHIEDILFIKANSGSQRRTIKLRIQKNLRLSY